MGRLLVANLRQLNRQLPIILLELIAVQSVLMRVLCWLVVVSTVVVMLGYWVSTSICLFWFLVSEH